MFFFDQKLYFEGKYISGIILEILSETYAAWTFHSVMAYKDSASIFKISEYLYLQCFVCLNLIFMY